MKQIVFLSFLLRIFTSVAISTWEYSALEELYTSLNGKNWNWQGTGEKWNFTGVHDPCVEGWEGLTCDSNMDYITEIELVDYNLVGTIPEAIGNLTELVTIDLSENDWLSGEIPYDGIEKLLKLEVLMIYEANLQGSVPSTFLKQNKYLLSVQFQFNLLSGHPIIPVSSTGLTQLNIYGNQFTGPIDNDIGNLVSLRSLIFGANQIQSTIPTSICNLTGLNTLSALSNRLKGSIPECMGNMTSLSYLDLSSNTITGTLPDSLGQLTNLQTLYLSTLKLTHATLPSSIGNLKQLQYFTGSLSGFVGSIPSSFLKLNDLVTFAFSGNTLTGSIPLNFSHLPHLTTLQLDNNFLEAVLDEGIAEARSLQVLDLTGNLIYGSIPASFRQLRNLTTLALTSNPLSGGLEEWIGDLASLQRLELQNCQLNGTIPNAIGNLTQLLYVDLSFNQFNGTLPASMGTLSLLQYLDAGHNLLHGSLAPALGALMVYQLSLVYNSFTGSLHSDLQPMFANTDGLYLSSNQFTGPLPEIFCGPSTTGVEINNNLLTGTISEAVFACTKLYVLGLSYNQLSGTLPEGLSSATQLYSLTLSDNPLTGTLPASWMSLTALNTLELVNNPLSGSIPENFFFPVLTALFLMYNTMTGTLPSAVGDMTRLTYCFIADTLLTGQIPQEIGQLQNLMEFVVVQNLLSGTMPDWRNATGLRVLQLEENNIGGSLEKKFGSTRFLNNIDVSNNRFTGPLPSEVFQLPQLMSFAAISNCLDLDLPADVCRSTSLVELALDGLQTAISCQQRYFPTIKSLPTYAIRRPQVYDMRWCLLNMTKLETLHLSGNLIGGSVPDDLVISPVLTSLSLSHNLLTGRIPPVIQERAWEELDLSFNKLTGTVDGILIHWNESLSIQDNRLSGGIPAAAISLADVSMLEGNLFACDEDRSDLPKHDPATATYECGSKSFDDSLWIWISLFGICLGILLLFYLLHSQSQRRDLQLRFEKLMELHEGIRSSFQAFNAVHQGTEQVHEVAALGKSLRQLAWRLLLGLLIVVFPSILVLTSLYRTYVHQYSWTAASIYISGTTPGIVLLLLFVAMITPLWLQLRLHHQAASPAVHSEEPRCNLAKLSWILLTCLLDMSIMLSVNVGYVLIYSQYDSTVVAAAQFCMALFKIFWNTVVMQRLITHIRRFCFHAIYGEETAMKHEETDILMFVCLSLFNNIAAPFVATAATNAQCYYYVLHEPDAVSCTYRYFNCVEIFEGLCEVWETMSKSTSYTPPFNYSYQCSSAFVTSYAAIYVYMYIFNGFLAFMLQGIVKFLHRRCSQRRGCYFRVLDALLPQILKLESSACSRFASEWMGASGSETDDALEKKSEGKSEVIIPLAATPLLFDKGKYIERNISHLAILVTFGFAFPPLAPIVAFSIFSYTYFTQCCMGRILLKGDALSDALNQQCAATTSLFYRCAWVVLPFACLFYSLFLLDIVGDSIGWRKALWAPLTLSFFPLVLWASYAVWRRWLSGQQEGSGQQQPYEALVPEEERKINAFHL